MHSKITLVQKQFKKSLNFSCEFILLIKEQLFIIIIISSSSSTSAAALTALAVVA
jgi:hypothetical protein